MALSKTDLLFLADNARAKMLDTWRSDAAYVASASSRVFVVASDGNLYHTNTSNGVDDDGNNIGPGAVNPVTPGQTTWSNDFTFGDITVSDLTVSGALALAQLTLSDRLNVDEIRTQNGSLTDEVSIPSLEPRFADAFANVSGTGTPSFNNQFGFSTVTRVSTGNYLVTASSALPANSSAVVTPRVGSARNAVVTAISTTQFSVFTHTLAGTAQDMDFSLQVFSN